MYQTLQNQQLYFLSLIDININNINYLKVTNALNCYINLLYVRNYTFLFANTLYK